jgi:cyclohexa-1,5-dienecarbonyl-CoA hydratase
MTSPLRERRDGAVARVSLARPPHNVLDRPLNRALAESVRRLANDPGVAVLVLDGSEARGFSAGVEVADHTPERIEGMLADFHGAIRALWDAQCVTVAALHGYALGGGLELALACDLVVAEENTRLAFPEIALGCYPPVAAAVLPSRVGRAVASEMVLTGEPFSVERARDLGLVNRACRAGGIEQEVARLLRPLLEKSPAVLREAKRALREGAAHAPADALGRIERRYLDSLMKLGDAAEGIAAFLEKRDPRFENR